MFDTTETEGLATELVDLAGRLASAQCRFLLLLAEFDRRGGWAGDGIRSCGHWLSWRLGMSYRTSRDQLRVARALVGLPRVTEAFSAGRLSYAKVRAITRIATPSTEGTLLDVALAGTASHVERAVRAIRRADTPAPASTAQRTASWRWDEDGYLILRAKLPPEDGARLVAALEVQLSAELTEPNLPVHIPEQRQAETVPGESDLAGGADAPSGSAEPPGTHSSQLTAGLEHAPARPTIGWRPAARMRCSSYWPRTTDNTRSWCCWMSPATRPSSSRMGYPSLELPLSGWLATVGYGR